MLIWGDQGHYTQNLWPQFSFSCILLTTMQQLFPLLTVRETFVLQVMEPELSKPDNQDGHTCSITLCMGLPIIMGSYHKFLKLEWNQAFICHGTLL